MMKLFAKIFSNVNLKLLSIVTKGSILDAWMGVQNVYLQVDITQFLNFNRDISLASKGDIILIILLQLKFRSVNFLSITQPFKQLSAGVKRIFVWKIFLQVIIKASVVEFIFNNIPYFQHIFMNTFRWMCLKYKTLFLERYLFLDITFDENTLKIQAASPCFSI